MTNLESQIEAPMSLSQIHLQRPYPQVLRQVPDVFFSDLKDYKPLSRELFRKHGEIFAKQYAFVGRLDEVLIFYN